MTKDEIKDYWHEYIWAYAVPMTEVGVEKMNAHWGAFFEGWKHAELNIYKKDEITKDQYGNADIPKWEPNLDVIKAHDACKEAIEQPAQEPVEYLGALANVDGSVNLYYKKSSWQGLSDDEIRAMANLHLEYDMDLSRMDDFARAIEQALKEKNNG